MEFGSILSGIGTLAGGFGLGSKGGETASPTDYVNANYYGLKGKHSFAKKYGYNPNYLMGGSVASPVVLNQAGGIDPAQVGAGLGAIAGGLQGKPKVQVAMQQLGLRQAEAETKNSEIQAQMAQLELDRMRQANNAQQDLGTAKTYPASEPSVQHIIGADGVARPISVPFLSEMGEPHYGDYMDLEAGIQGLKDRGIPMASEKVLGLLNEFRKGGAHLGRALHGVLNSAARGRRNYVENR